MNICINCKYYRYMFNDHYCVNPSFFKNSNLSGDISKITGKYEYKSDDFSTMLCYAIRSYEGDSCIHFVRNVSILKRILNIKPFRVIRNICRKIYCSTLLKKYKEDD